MEELEKWIENKDLRNLILDRNFFDKYYVQKQTANTQLPYSIFIGHSSMKNHVLGFDKIARTDLIKKIKITLS